MFSIGLPTADRPHSTPGRFHQTPDAEALAAIYAAVARAIRCGGEG